MRSVRYSTFFARPLALVALLLAAVAAHAEAAIERVSFTPRADGRGYVVRFHAEGRIGAYSVERPTAGAIQLVVYRARLAPGLRRDEARGPVRDYRVDPADDRLTFTFTLVAGAGFASGPADWRFVLPLDRLAPGEYLLTIEAALDGRTETRHVRFAVVG